jgi:hypothetical protein
MGMSNESNKGEGRSLSRSRTELERRCIERRCIGRAEQQADITHDSCRVVLMKREERVRGKKE